MYLRYNRCICYCIVRQMLHKFKNTIVDYRLGNAYVELCNEEITSTIYCMHCRCKDRARSLCEMQLIRDAESASVQTPSAYHSATASLSVNSTTVLMNC